MCAALTTTPSKGTLTKHEKPEEKDNAADVKEGKEGVVDERLRRWSASRERRRGPKVPIGMEMSPREEPCNSMAPFCLKATESVRMLYIVFQCDH